MLYQDSHCSAIPSWESNILVSKIFPSAVGTLIRWPSVRTPSTSIIRSRMRDARVWMSGVMRCQLASSILSLDYERCFTSHAKFGEINLHNVPRTIGTDRAILMTQDRYGIFDDILKPPQGPF